MDAETLKLWLLVITSGITVVAAIYATYRFVYNAPVNSRASVVSIVRETTERDMKYLIEKTDARFREVDDNFERVERRIDMTIQDFRSDIGALRQDLRADHQENTKRLDGIRDLLTQHRGA